MTHPLPEDDLHKIASRTFWRELEGKRILFTGASGFFGSWLLETYLFASDAWSLPGKALALTRDAGRFRKALPHLANNSRVELIEGNAEDFSAPSCRLDAIIHSVVPDAIASLPDCRRFFQHSTQHLLRIASERDCGQFLLCSTGAVYRTAQPARPFSEHDPMVCLDGPLSYGSIRREVEEMCLRASVERRLPVKIARGFAFAGPRLPLDGNFAFGNFLRDGLAGRDIVVESDGTAVRSYLYAGEMAEWLWSILLRGDSGEAFNVGSAAEVTIGELARAIGDCLGVQVEIRGEAKPGVAPSYYVPSIAKAAEVLDLRPACDLSDCIEKNVRWHRSRAPLKP